MLEPVLRRWAWSACLVALVLSAASAAASLDSEREQVREETQDMGSTAAAQSEYGQGLAAQGVAFAQDSSPVQLDPDPEDPAPEASGNPGGSSGSGGSGNASQPSSPPQGQNPPPRPWGGLQIPRPATPKLPTRVVQEALDPVLQVLPDDPVGLARDTADHATAIPGALLAPEEPAEEAPATQSQAVEPSGPSVLLVSAAVLITAGAATAATFFGVWLAGSSGAVATKAGATAATRAGDLRRLLPFASPLFTRFERDTVLGHPRREALYALILQEPGISLQALGDASGLSRTAVIHHLRLLEQQHLIVSRRVGRSRHYFENGGRYGHDQKEAYAVLQNGRSKAVAEFIKGHPGAMQKALCEALGIQPSIAHWHVRRLEEARVVETVRKGRTVAYFPGPGLQAMAQTAAGQAAPAESSPPAATA